MCFGCQKLLQGHVLDTKLIAKTSFGHQNYCKDVFWTSKLIARTCFGRQKLLQGRVLDIKIIAGTSMLSYESPDIL